MLKDSFTFTCFFFVWVVLFSLLFEINGIIIDVPPKPATGTTSKDYDDFEYKSVPKMIMNCIQIYRNSIGDISPPDYTYWLKEQDANPITSMAMVYIVWLLWFFNQYLVFMILLAKGDKKKPMFGDGQEPLTTHGARKEPVVRCQC